MWRQADNPLAPSDKYEARRAFPAFSRDYARLSVESEEKNDRTFASPFSFPPLPLRSRAVSHSRSTVMTRDGIEYSEEHGVKRQRWKIVEIIFNCYNFVNKRGKKKYQTAIHRVPFQRTKPLFWQSWVCFFLPMLSHHARRSGNIVILENCENSNISEKR